MGTRTPEITPPVGSVEDVTDAPVPVRIYRPEGGPGPTAIVYFHGGGFVIGSIETHDLQARALCRATSALVVSADYRLAPEHPWPAGGRGLHRQSTSGRWSGSTTLRSPATAPAGTLPAVTAQALRDRVSAQLLAYPVADLSHDENGRYPSRVECADGYFLTQGDMRFFAPLPG